MATKADGRERSQLEGVAIKLAEVGLEDELLSPQKERNKKMKIRASVFFFILFSAAGLFESHRAQVIFP